MTYTKKQFIEDVKKEARALRRHATKREISQLSFEDLSPSSKYRCVYGLMTGNCFSERAAELIHACCKRYFISSTEDGDSIGDSAELGKVTRNVNGKKVPGVENATDLCIHRNHWTFHLSSIEAYIMQPSAKNKNLIDYLKGNRNDLVL